MREATDQPKKKKKIAAWICAGIVIAALLAYLAIALIPIISESLGDGFVIAFITFYVLLFGSIILGILIALKLRLKEIEGGEEEDAQKY